MAGLFLSRRKKPAAGFEPATGFLGANRKRGLLRSSEDAMAARRPQGRAVNPQNAGAFRLPHSPAPPVAFRDP